MLRLVAMSMRVFVSGFRSRRDLLLENLALRQQLATLAPRRPALSPGPPTEPSGSPFDSCGLAGRTPSSSSSLRQSSVGTVLTSGCTGGGCPAAVTGEVAVAREVRHLIRRMATENL